MASKKTRKQQKTAGARHKLARRKSDNFRRVIAAVQRTVPAWLGDDRRRRWISDVVAEGIAKDELLAAHKAGKVILSRADLQFIYGRPGMSAELGELELKKRRRSMIRDSTGGQFEYVALP
jgi:hypothetical protein